MAGTIALLAVAPSGVPFLLPPCPVHRYLHLLCPGCGGTRACIALLHGNLREAWQHNAFLLLLSPLLALRGAVALFRLWRGRTDAFPPIPAPVRYSLFAASALFTIARNLPR